LITPKSTEILRLFRGETPFAPAESKRRWRVSIHLMPEETFAEYRRWLGPWRDPIERRSAIDLKRFLECFPGSTVVVTLLARDAVTGSPTAVQHSYGQDDFHNGRFPGQAGTEPDSVLADADTDPPDVEAPRSVEPPRTDVPAPAAAACGADDIFAEDDSPRDPAAD
jgi:hypothetical protein